MTRQYTVSEKVKAAQVERARKGAAALHSPVTLAKRLKPRIAELTDEQWSELVAARREGADGS